MEETYYKIIKVTNRGMAYMPYATFFNLTDAYNCLAEIYTLPTEVSVVVEYSVNGKRRVSPLEITLEKIQAANYLNAWLAEYEFDKSLFPFTSQPIENPKRTKKKFVILASYDKKEWSDWSETDDPEECKNYCERVKYFGYYSRVYENKKLIYESNEKDEPPYYNYYIDANHHNPEVFIKGIIDEAIDSEEKYYESTKDLPYSLWQKKDYEY